MPTHDLSKSRVIKMPRLTEGTAEVDVWFEEGMIWMDDPTDPSQVVRLSIGDFAERVQALVDMVERMEEKYGESDRIVHCGKRAWARFRREAHDLIEESKRQLHVGLHPDVIFAEEKARRPIHSRSMFGMPRFESTQSGLIVPAD